MIYLNQIFFFWIKINFLKISNHLTPLQVNHSTSAQCLRVANSNYATKIKQIYIQMKKKKKKKKINKIKSWIDCVEIRIKYFQMMKSRYGINEL